MSFAFSLSTHLERVTSEVRVGEWRGREQSREGVFGLPGVLGDAEPQLCTVGIHSIVHFFFPAALWSIPDLSSLTRDQTHASTAGSPVLTTGPLWKFPITHPWTVRTDGSFPKCGSLHTSPCSVFAFGGEPWLRQNLLPKTLTQSPYAKLRFTNYIWPLYSTLQFMNLSFQWSWLTNHSQNLVARTGYFWCSEIVCDELWQSTVGTTGAVVWTSYS